MNNYMHESTILSELEFRCRQNPQGVCFYIATQGQEDEVPYESVTYEQLRNRSVRLARALFDQGLTRGRWCAADMPNCAEFVYLIVASLISGIPLVLLNNRLTSAEKGTRIREACQAIGIPNLRVFTRDSISNAIAWDTKTYGEDDFDASHLICRAHDAYEPDSPGLTVFSSGSFGNPRPVMFTWGNVHGAARSMNTTVSRPGEGLWQLAMPLNRVAGVQVVYRSLLNGNPFILYREFFAQRLLDDVRGYGATHVSVWGSMLKGLVSCAAQTEEGIQALRSYQCVLLGGSSPAHDALEQAIEMKVRVYASFGMTETCGNVAACLATSGFNGRLFSLPDYQLAVISPDESGFGNLAVKGPGVAPMELNPKSVFTVDGFLLTNVLAKVDDPGVRLFRPADESFVSGGEDIDPREITEQLLLVPGVTDAYVFADEDEEWGRRPVAIVETAAVSRETGCNLQLLADKVGESLSEYLDPLLRPDRIIAVPEFPRTGVGEVDYSQLRLLYSQRLDVRKVEAWVVRAPLDPPQTLGAVRLKEREILVVRVTDWAGRTGVGESLAYPRVCRARESLEDGSEFLRSKIAPLLINHVFVHPSQASVLWRSVDGAAAFPYACAALESAIWDLGGKVDRSSLVEMIGGRDLWQNPESDPDVPQGGIPCGAAIEYSTEWECVEKVRKAVEIGCESVRIKIKPGCDASLVNAIRKEHPRLNLVLDGNQAYTETSLKSIFDLEGYNISCIIDPLDPSAPPKVGPQGIWERLSRLQRDLGASICVERCWNGLDDLKEGLRKHSTIRCASLRVSKLGGIQPALEFYWWARQKGIMLLPVSEGASPVSSRIQAAFQTLPGMNVSGDFPLSDREVIEDACVPGLVFESGTLRINTEGFEYGVGCEIDPDLLEKHAQVAWVVK